MKRSIAFLLIVAVVALAALALPAATTAIQDKADMAPQDTSPAFSKDGVYWDLARVQIVNEGQVINMDEGLFIKGIVLEAQARSSNAALVPDGTYRLTFDVFSPARDMIGQKAGLFYMQGNWTISGAGASTESLQARHSPDVIRGTLQAELKFNPVKSNGKWSALARLPMSPAAGHWSRGQGALDLDGMGGGSLSLDVKLGPASQLGQ